MAWTTVPTFVSGNILTAAQMNGLGSDLNELRGDFAISRYTTGNITMNNTAWTNLSGPADLVLACDVDDVIEVQASCIVSNENVEVYFDAVTVVSGSPVNSVGTGTAPTASSRGVVGWQGWPNQYSNLTGGSYYKLVSGDISAGTVTLRLRFRTASAVNKVIFGNASYPMNFMARNHGPIEI